MRVYKDGDYIRYRECDPCGTPEKKAKPPTDAERIAAAVAALSTPDAVEAVKWTREGEGITREECDMGIAITKALAILEGREVLKDV